MSSTGVRGRLAGELAIHHHHPRKRIQQRRVAMNKPRTQACQRCRKKKLKCDVGLPVCKSCSSSGQPCTMLDPVSSREYERSYVAGLERQVRDLDSLFGTASSRGEEHPYLVQGDSSSDGHVHNAEEARAVDNIALNRSMADVDDVNSPSCPPTAAPQYVGESSELNFTQLMISDLQSRTLTAKTPKLTEAFLSIRTARSTAVDTTPNELPSAAEAQELTMSYIFGNHVAFPVLSRAEIFELYRRVYGAPPDATQISETIHASPNSETASPQDLYRINMILGIASASMLGMRSENKQSMGYYFAAMRNFGRVPTILGIEAAQNLLLLADFTMIQDTGCSIWDIGRTCMRICILLDLHRDRPGLNESDSNIQRLVFWACYSLDRVASTALGRPYAISDVDITVQLPQETQHQRDDPAAVAALGMGVSQQPSPENSFFVASVKLRRLSSEISTYFYRLRRKGSSSEVSENIGGFLARMEEWRLEVAYAFPHEEVVFYEKTWLDYMVAKEKLSLARAAINLVACRESRVPKDLRDLCLGAAMATIEMYTVMFRAGKITFSRLYFYVLFSASVSCIYCILVECGDAIGLPIDEFDLSCGSESKVRVFRSLETAVDVLRNISSTLLDLRDYSTALGRVVSQIRGSRGGVGLSHNVQPVDEPEHNMYSGNLPQMDEADWAYGQSLPAFGNDGISIADWQNLGTEMWQFVEPGWPDFVPDHNMFDAVSNGATGNIDWDSHIGFPFGG